MIKEETRQRIEKGLREWNNPLSEARQRFEKAKKEWDVRLQSVSEAIERSEHLTEKDFGVIITI